MVGRQDDKRAGLARRLSSVLLLLLLLQCCLHCEMTTAGDEDAPSMADLMAAKTGDEPGPRAVKFDVYFSFSTS